ncbi:MAG TPA: pitrilysin family protein [Erysipelotrichaceae bacterium]|nr:pitrilysin family protein [Erysipelotrichaceae bacterium]
MEIVHFPEINESHYISVLQNGLKVIIIQKKDYKSSSCFMAFPYGSLDIKQKINQEIHDYPSGIAHFLEHKLFENNNGLDIMETFSHLSANVNAFTSHTETVYYFNSSKKNIKKPLNLLLDFVQQLSITEQSVEKEKGIIIQELRMYMQMPEQRLMLETYQSLYEKHPIRLDIGGNEESVSSITKEVLERCYALNYHPSNALLVCITPTNPQLILDWIVENQNAKNFQSTHNIERVVEIEGKQVYRKHFEFEMDIQSSKMTYSFKMNDLSSDSKTNLLREWKYRLFLELIFSPMNPKYEVWMNENRIHDYFGYDVDLNNEYGFILFFGENEDEVDFKKLVIEGLNTDITHFETYFELLKRRYFAQLLRQFDDQDDYALTLIRSKFNKLEITDSIHALKEINFIDLLSVSSEILSLDTTFVKMNKKSK